MITYFVLPFKASLLSQSQFELHSPAWFPLPAALLPNSWPGNAASTVQPIISLLVSGLSNLERIQSYIDNHNQHKA